MPLGRQYRDAVHRIAEPRQQTVAAIRVGTEDGKDQSACPTGYNWLVDYRAFVDPDADDPAWVEVLNGDYFTVVHFTADGIFTIIDDADAEYLYYTSSQPTLDNEIGTMLEAEVAITTSEGGVRIYDSSADDWSGGPNRGAAMSIFDGTYQFTVWLRFDSLNIDDEDSIAIDLTDSHTIRLEARQKVCKVYVDKVLKQTGGFMNSTTERLLTFGSFISIGQITRGGSQSTSLWDYVRGRWMNN